MPKRISLTLTDEQREYVARAAADADRERPEILAEAHRVFAADDAVQVELRGVFSLLRAVRKDQGVSLNELAARTGISKPSLSRLENDPAPNVQLNTLVRIATALGKDLRISLANAAPTRKPRRRTAVAR
ncbi:MAG: helix-turn-helix transcriptional regulator [Planctomycetaceae bacterium]|nr:helix-turn-helix transcriptional regulator [Planctomycetaceae bacterium]